MGPDGTELQTKSQKQPESKSHLNLFNLNIKSTSSANSKVIEAVEAIEAN
jgi:hypothetical protein